MKVKDSIIVIRKAILCHIKNPEIRQFLYGLLSYEMISYVFFGVFTAIIDYCVYAFLSVLGINVMFSNALSWLCAVIFSFSTNRQWVLIILRMFYIPLINLCVQDLPPLS